MSVKKILGLLLVSCIIFFLCIPTGYFIFKTSSSGECPQQDKNCQGIVAYIINLDRSRERYNYVLPSVSHLGFPVQRISAVDGQALRDQVVQDVVDSEAYKNFSGKYPKRGTIGCSLSHIKAWQTFLQSNFQFALIFEDDISFSPAHLTKIVRLLTEAPQTTFWDINSFESKHRGAPLTLKTLEDGSKLVVYLTAVTHTGAYLINRKAARQLLAKALPIKMPVDHYFTRNWEFDLKFTGIEPRLVTQSYGDSDINASCSAPPSEMNESSSLHRARYIAQSQIIRFFYNLKIYAALKFSSQ